MQYKNEVDKPKEASKGAMPHMESAKDFKSQAMDTAYGAASMKGCESDNKKIHSQFNHSYGDYGSNSGY